MVRKKVSPKWKKIFSEYNNYDLYNYINLNFSDDLENFNLNKKEDEIIDYLLDAFYDLDLEYYNNKIKYGYEKAYSILINNIEKVKKTVIERLS